MADRERLDDIVSPATIELWRKIQLARKRDRYRMRLISVLFLAGSFAVFAAGLYVGFDYSRRQIRNLADEMTTDPTNSFTRCLTENWELSGELDPAWKGKRRWQLVETKP